MKVKTENLNRITMLLHLPDLDRFRWVCESQLNKLQGYKSLAKMIVLTGVVLGSHP